MELLSVLDEGHLEYTHNETLLLCPDDCKELDTIDDISLMELLSCMDELSWTELLSALDEGHLEYTHKDILLLAWKDESCKDESGASLLGRAELSAIDEKELATSEDSIEDIKEDIEESKEDDPLKDDPLEDEAHISVPEPSHLS